MKPLLFGIFIISCCLTTVSNADNAGFDEVCTIYNEIKNSSMSYEVANKYVHDNINKRVRSKDAIKLHSVMPNVNPNDRYNIFKQTVEEITNTNWNCPAMQSLMGKTSKTWKNH